MRCRRSCFVFLATSALAAALWLAVWAIAILARPAAAAEPSPAAPGAFEPRESSRPAGSGAPAADFSQPAPGRLEWFQDLRFGLFLHWGIYSELGCIESWPLVYADRSWSNPSIQSLDEMIAFRQKYFALNRRFNPTRFAPEDWARAAQRAGMKYVMFTTKHHDGFSMFDTRQTDFRVTHADCPFSRDPRANIAKQVFEAFRREGLGIGCYFSKSDWHSPYYWSGDNVPLDRNPNYDTAEHPERWEKFVRFVHAQIEELLTDYGHIDILWLDGGQVRPPKQDLRMDELVAMARRLQPHVIVVDRTVGRYEDYRTPEQEVPETPLPYVWESCLTMGTQWSYKPDDEYKSPRALIHLLVDIAAKGGNLLLNIGPKPDGTLPETAVARLEEIGRWMDVNAEAIHATRPLAPYKEGNICLTRKGDVVYAIYLAGEDETRPPERIRLASVRPREGSRVALLGRDEACRWSIDGGGLLIELPAAARAEPPCRYAWVVRIDGDPQVSP